MFFYVWFFMYGKNLPKIGKKVPKSEKTRFGLTLMPKYSILM